MREIEMILGKKKRALAGGKDNIAYSLRTGVHFQCLEIQSRGSH